MKRIISFILLCLILGGCTPKTTQDQFKWVTRITADYQKGVIRLHREYTDDEKMRPVLDYFRSLSPYGKVENVPDEGAYAQVTVYFSDGSKKIYEQKSDGFIRENGGNWQNINPEKGQELGVLLGLAISDENF